MPDQASPALTPTTGSEPRNRVTFHRRGVAHDAPRLGVPIDEAAAMLGVSYMTLWRAIRENQFPGMQLRGWIIVPLVAVDLLLRSAVESGELVDSAAWTANWRAELAHPARACTRCGGRIEDDANPFLCRRCRGGV